MGGQIGGCRAIYLERHIDYATLFVLVEKVVPTGHLLGRIAGLSMIAWGGAWLISLAV